MLIQRYSINNITQKKRYESSFQIRKDSGKMWFSKCKNSDVENEMTAMPKHNMNNLQAHLKQDFNTENGAVIVRMVDTDGYNHFTRFEMFDKCMHLMNRIEDRFRNFHEVILGNYSQKLRFDIDFEYSSEDINPIYKSYEVLVACIQACYKVLANPHSHANTINLLEYPQTAETFDSYIKNLFEFIDKHVIVCTSNRPNKCSYHIIIDGFYALNSVHAKTVADMIICRVPEDLKTYIDIGVYKSFQHFRILGGTKAYILQDGRKKYSTLEYVKNIPDICEFVLKKDYDYDKEYKQYKSVEFYSKKENYYHLFKNCLISYTLGSKPLNFVPEKKTVVITKIPKHVVEESISQFRKYLDKNSLNFKFLISGVKDSIITIRRLKASLCPICMRVHDSENPYIYILERKKLEGVVNLSEYHFYYNCRRHDNTVKNLKFGMITSKLIVDEYKKYFDFDDKKDDKNNIWTIQDMNSELNCNDYNNEKIQVYYESDSDSENTMESACKISKLIEAQLLKELELEDKKIKIEEKKENLPIIKPKEIKKPKFIVKQENMMDY